MRKLSKITILAGIVLAVMLMVQPALAACSNARLINANYIYGVPDEIPGPTSQAWFWALGSGIQGIGTGNDSGANAGSFDGYGYSGGGWFNHPYAPYVYGYGYVAGSWGTGGTDGCIDATVAPTLCNVGGCCTAVLISDEFNGQGYFAFMTSSANAGQNYENFAPVALTALPKPNITASLRVDASNVDVTVACPSQAALAPGLALDPTCPSAVVTGCKLYSRNVARGGTPAADRELVAWNAVSVSDAIPGGEETVRVSCAGDEDVYLTQAIVFDSGFELRYGGENSTRVECGPNLAKPVRRLQDGTTPTRKKSRRTR